MVAVALHGVGGGRAITGGGGRLGPPGRAASARWRGGRSSPAYIKVEHTMKDGQVSGF